MARYIDAEKVDLKGIAVFDENLEVLVPLSDVRKALQMTPTADVVPKREVENLFEDVENLVNSTAFADWWSEGRFRRGIAKLKKKFKEENNNEN